MVLEAYEIMLTERVPIGCGQYTVYLGGSIYSHSTGDPNLAKILEDLILVKYDITPIDPYYLIHVGSHYYYIIYSYYRHTLFSQ